MSQDTGWIEEQLRAGNAPPEITGELMRDFLQAQHLRFAFPGGVMGDEYPVETCFRVGTHEVPSRGMTLRYQTVLEWDAERKARAARFRWISATQGFASETFPISWERAMLLAIIDRIADKSQSGGKREPDALFQAAIGVAHMNGAGDGQNPVTEDEIAHARHAAELVRQGGYRHG